MTYAKWAHERKAEEAEKALKRNPSEYWAGVELMDLLEEALCCLN
jgi:hypothetical protein